MSIFKNVMGQMAQGGLEGAKLQQVLPEATTQSEFTEDEKAEQILKKARSSYVVQIVNKGDEMTDEDLEILDAVQSHIEEELEEVATEDPPEKLICSLSMCYITGCEVHTITPDFIHYGRSTCNCGDIKNISSMSPRVKLGYEHYKKNPGCSYVEVYDRHICVVGGNGAVTVVNE